MIREFQLKPDIRIYFERGEIETNYVYLILENKGFGTTLNVNYIFFSNLSSYSDDYFDVKDKGVFKNVVSAFYPNQKFSYYLLNVNQENISKSIKRINDTIEDLIIIQNKNI